MTINERIPLFPLGVVLFPGIPLPLHIFEDRYKTMINECLRDDRPFGVVFYDGSGIKKVGCTAQVTRVVKEYEDGRLDILTMGLQRFEILKTFQDKAYPEAEIHYFDDVAEDYQAELNDLSGEVVELLKELARKNKVEWDMEDEEETEHQMLSFYIASSEGFNLEEKQQLLEMRSTIQRLRRTMEVLKKILKRLELSDEIRKIISGNGHLPHLLKGGT